jgi:hypothetical protein
VIDDGTITLHRVSYPVEHTINALQRSGASAAAIADLSILLRTGRVPPPRAMTVESTDGDAPPLPAGHEA